MDNIEIIESCRQLNAAEWDDLVKGRAFCSYRWLQLAETILVDQRMRYILIRRDGRLQAAAIGTIQKRFQLGAYVPNRVLRIFLDFFLKYFKPLTWEMPFADKPGFFWRKGSDLNQIHTLFLKAVRRSAGRERAFFQWIPHLKIQDPFLPILYRRGYFFIPMRPDSMLQIDWPDYESYLAARPYKKRKDLRRASRRARETGVKIDAQSLAIDSEPRLVELVRELLGHFKQPFPFITSFFSRARDILGHDLIILTARQNDQVIACGALLRDGEECLLKWLGLDYAATRNSHTYHLLVVEAIAKAMALGIRTLHTGSGVYEIKKLIGAALEERLLAVSVRVSFFRPLLGLALSLLGKRRRFQSWPTNRTP